MEEPFGKDLAWTERDLPGRATASDRPERPRNERDRGRSPTEPTTILVCERDEKLKNLLRQHAAHSSIRILSAHDGDEAIWMLRKLQADSIADFLLIVTDFDLPKQDGLELCRFVRSQPALNSVPILMVGDGTDPDLCVKILNEGADDCLKKPFSARELESRIGALMRRRDRHQKKDPRHPFDRMELGPLTVDTNRFEVRLHGKVVRLSYKEFQLCVALVSRFDKMVPYEELLRLLWGEDYEVGRENLKVHIHSLKKKLAKGPTIEAIRGFGYRMKNSS